MRLPKKMVLHHGSEVEKTQRRGYGAVDITPSPTPPTPTRAPTSSRQSFILPKRQWNVSIIISIVTMAAIYRLLTTFLLASSSLATPIAGGNSSKPADDSSEAFWAGLQPSRQLQWHKCYHGILDCARLDVPLDWLEPSDEERVVLAVVRLPAENRTDYRGPLFWNPGGPGGSGVTSLIAGTGRLLQRKAGDNHDIVSWDPRGVGASVPRIECWATSVQRNSWALQGSNVIDGTPGVLFDALARSDAASRHCEAHVNATTPNLLSHISTASHARDMLEISKQLGQEKIKYWGYSYGTLLGGTFAAMYPDRVERIVSDGNVDYRDWYDNTHLNYLQDADKIIQAFFKFCNMAGPERCPFFEPTPDAIEKKFSALFTNLRRSPVLVPAGNNQTQLEVPQLVTVTNLLNHIRDALYNPLEQFPRLAKVLAVLEKRDGASYFQLVRQASASSGLDVCNMEDTLPTIPDLVDASEDAHQAIMCSDGALLPADKWTPDAVLNYAAGLLRVSKYIGAPSVQSRLLCAGRQIRPRWTFAGPYQNITTAFPMLFIGNIADPVTPLESARNNSRAFPGSVVLVQKSYGHGSFAGPSNCTGSAIREYFQNGKLPAAGMVCEQDRQPFEDLPESLMDTRGEMLVDERERQVAARRLAKTNRMIL